MKKFVLIVGIVVAALSVTAVRVQGGGKLVSPNMIVANR